MREEQVLAIHKKCIEQFGGKDGLRDKNLFLSALGQPAHTFDGEYLYDSIYKMAAVYLFSFAKDHAFFDGNKRVALQTCYLFLYFNNVDLLLSNDEFCDLILGCIEGKYDLNKIAGVIEKNSVDIY